jgi:hypothetical protein
MTEKPDTIDRTFSLAEEAIKIAHQLIEQRDAATKEANLYSGLYHSTLKTLGDVVLERDAARAKLAKFTESLDTEARR